jgi:Flp pilus assembly protein TadG
MQRRASARKPQRWLNEKLIAMHNVAKFAILARQRSLRRFVKGCEEGVSGAAAVEFAIIVPVLLVLLVFTIDLSIGFYRKMQVQNAAQAGAQYAAVHGFDATSVSIAILSATSFSGIAASPAPSQFCGCPTSTGVTTTTCGSSCASGSAPGTYVRASTVGSYNTVFSYPGIPKPFNFIGQATVRLQ